MEMKQKISELTFVLMIALCYSCAFLFPVLQTLSTHLASRADGVFISWTIYAVASFVSEGKNIFNLPIFYPYLNTLTYSDPFLPTALSSIPFLYITKNPILISNLHLFFGTVIMYISAYLLAKELKFSTLASHLTALFFTFSSMHLHYIVHLQSYLLAGLPLTLCFFIKWLKTDAWYWLLLVFFGFLYQMLNSPMSGFFLIFAFIPLLVSIFISKKMNVWKLRIVKNKFLILYYSTISLIFLLPIYVPYFINSKTFMYVRTIQDTAHFSQNFEYFFSFEKILFYIALTILFITQKKKTKEQLATNSILSFSTIIAITLTGALLSLGPVLKIHGSTYKLFETLPIPLPYAVLYYIVPGFKAFRDSSRWIVLFNFGLSILFGYFFTHTKLNKKSQILFFVTILVILYLFSKKSMDLYPIPLEHPQIYEQVAERQEKTLVELPIFTWSMAPYAYLENDRLLYQLVHKKKLYNGVSGFAPPTREYDIDTLIWSEFPSNKTIHLFKEANIELVIIHYDLFDEMNLSSFKHGETFAPSRTKLKEQVQLQPALQLISCAQEKCLYKLK